MDDILDLKVLGVHRPIYIALSPALLCVQGVQAAHNELGLPVHGEENLIKKLDPA